MASDYDMLTMVKDSLEAGGRGVSIGRNIFQHKDVEGITRAISDIVLRGATVEEAMKNIKKS
jgi:DhnA family fructose-bisphosphate aldolase class Ia